MGAATGRFVYAGLREGQSRPLVAVWYRLAADGTVDPALDMVSFPKNAKSVLGGTAWVGDVYEIAVDGESCRLGARQDPFPDQEQKARWRLEERAAEAAVARERAAAREGFGDLTLDQLHEQYRKTIGSARRAGLLASVLQHVTG